MKRFRAAKLVRVLFAALFVAVSVGTSPVIGHAHGLDPAPSHDDHGWPDHHHAPRHHEDGGGHDDPGDALEVAASFFHLHGAWFGVPFSLPTSLSMGQGEQVGQLVDSDACRIRAVTLGADHLGWDLPSACWLLPPLRAPRARPCLPTSRPFDGASMPDAIFLRSVSLRC